MSSMHSISDDHDLVELKPQVQAGQPSSIILKAIDKVRERLGDSGVNLVYAGYPYDPYVLDAAKR